MANPASTSSHFSIPFTSLQDDDVVLDRLSAASQSKIYPTKCSRTEMPLRRILLVTRLWNEVRHHQTIRSAFPSPQSQRSDMDFHTDWKQLPQQPSPSQQPSSKSAEVPVVLDDEFALSLLPSDLVEVDMGHVVDWDEEIEEDESSSSEEEEANARKRRDDATEHVDDKDRRAPKRRKDQSVPPFEEQDHSTTTLSAGPILSEGLPTSSHVTTTA
ncbi:hypothetical protein NQZ79_g8358 [Umbelopsis isabellina]|nr:hypothetical protein NQZ79_g8358 [Umbelopsis isabellina]